MFTVAPAGAGLSGHCPGISAHYISRDLSNRTWPWTMELEESSQPRERRGTKRPQSSQSTLLSFVFKKPKGVCPEPDDASSEFQAFTLVSNCTYIFDRVWL